MMQQQSFDASNLSISKAILSDLPFIVECQKALAQESEGLSLQESSVRLGVLHVLENPVIGFYLVARNIQNEPYATLLVQHEWSDWRARMVWWIHSIYVVHQWRGKGIFRNFMKYLEKEAKERDIAGLRLYVDKSNTGAQSVYKKLGMTSEHYLLFEKMFP